MGEKGADFAETAAVGVVGMDVVDIMDMVDVFIVVMGVGLVGVMVGFGLVGVGGAFVDGEGYALDVLTDFALPVGVEVADLELGQFPFEGGGFDAEVAQGPDGHVAADAGEAVEIENTHSRALFHCLGDFPSALAIGLVSAVI